MLVGHTTNVSNAINFAVSTTLEGLTTSLPIVFVAIQAEDNSQEEIVAEKSITSVNLGGATILRFIEGLTTRSYQWKKISLMLSHDCNSSEKTAASV